MFSKISRYRKLPDIVTTDPKGRALASKSLRPLPDVSGTFLHTVEEGDRLDRLSFKFYKQPRKWWRGCDANPTFMSPQALLGKEPIVTERFPLTFNRDRSQPPWAALIQQLSERVGVENLQVVDEVRMVPEAQTMDGKQVTVYMEHDERAVIVTYNPLNVSAKDLADVMTAQGFVVGHPENIGRVGKNITIPPDVVG